MRWRASLYSQVVSHLTLGSRVTTNVAYGTCEEGGIGCRCLSIEALGQGVRVPRIIVKMANV